MEPAVAGLSVMDFNLCVYMCVMCSFCFAFVCFQYCLCIFFCFSLYQKFWWIKMYNNPITLISPVQLLGYIFVVADSICVNSSANFRTVFSESQNANPLDAEPEPDFNAKWPYKVIQGHPFRCKWRAIKGLHSTIYCGLECEGNSEGLASQRSENRHLRRPHSHLTPPL